MQNQNKLDLQYHAKLCFNYLTGMVDEKLDCLPYWLIAINENPAYAKHCRVDDAELVASWSEALIRMRQMTASKEGLRAEAGIKRHLLKDFGKDGLRYHHKYPWTQSIFCNIHETAYVLSALATWYAESQEKMVRKKAGGLVRGLGKIANSRTGKTFWSGDFPQTRKSYFFPYDNYYKGKGYDPSKWTGRGEEALRNGIVICPLVMWYEAGGDEASLDLAEGLINHIIYECRTFNYEQHYTGHVHSAMWIASGVVRFSIVTGNKELLRWAKGIYDFTRSRSSAFGWVPEYIGWHDPRQEHCETCCIKDMIECASYLIEAGYDEYWEDIDNFSRNHLVESQLKSGDFIKVNNRRKDTIDTTYRDIDRRVIGGFSGGTEPNSLSLSRFRSLAGCCGGTGPQAFYLAWKNIVTKKGEGVYVNLAIDRDSEYAGVKSSYPEEGKIEVKVHKDTPLFIRIPKWAGERVALFLDNRPQCLVWEGDYLSIPQVKKGQTVTVTHPMPEQKKNEIVRGGELTSNWRGSTVLGIFPEGDPLALYKRGKKSGRKTETAQPDPQ